MTIAAKVIFFDIGATLATVIPGDTPGSIKGFALLDWTLAMLDAALRSGARLGIISNTGDFPGSMITPLLDEAGIKGFFEPDLLIYSKDVGHTKDTPTIFRLAAARTGCADDEHACLFVGEDGAERQTAATAGLRSLAPPVFDFSEAS
ncbi:conserved hypothetical protein [Sphingomonas aurantiaca]|uniref:Uncharacterized protein n=1 Tax=Sphingomonas aurantiaca TaxID=185949 RepID=A0A5E7ZZG7_9SPHN|nr:HAD family hydrolase [Sphingomonas aurantiaca]VVT24419.1 conserved hypothetical protein [Sphingomonas aurantiaca]